jgi:hypothetical protein
MMSDHRHKINGLLMLQLGRAEANRKESKSCLDRVFHFKFVRFAPLKEVHSANARPHIKLRT